MVALGGIADIPSPATLLALVENAATRTCVTNDNWRASLARPRRAADIGGKRREILREIVPGMKRFAILGDSGTQATAPEMRQVQDAVVAWS
jgi:hypothetical protein